MEYYITIVQVDGGIIWAKVYSGRDSDLMLEDAKDWANHIMKEYNLNRIDNDILDYSTEEMISCIYRSGPLEFVYEKLSGPVHTSRAIITMRHSN